MSRVKRLRDDISDLCRERKVAETANKLASVIIEKTSNLEMLLEELIREINEEVGPRTKKRLENSCHEKVLVNVGNLYERFLQPY